MSTQDSNALRKLQDGIDHILGQRRGFTPEYDMLRLLDLAQLVRGAESLPGPTNDVLTALANLEMTATECVSSSEPDLVAAREVLRHYGALR